MEFVQNFMFAAYDMGMTDPAEYVYISMLNNALDIKKPWRGQTARPNADSAFIPVLQVSFISCYISCCI